MDHGGLPRRAINASHAIPMVLACDMICPGCTRVSLSSFSNFKESQNREIRKKYLKRSKFLTIQNWIFFWDLKKVNWVNICLPPQCCRDDEMVRGYIRDYSRSQNLRNSVFVGVGRRTSAMNVADAGPSSGEEHETSSEEQGDPGGAKRSLGIFSIHSTVRKRIVKVVSSSYFGAFILTAILLNSVLMACVDYRFIDDNYQPSADLSLRNNIIEWAEIVFTILFSVECVLKIIAYGLFCGERTYLRDGWNVLDFIIVIVSVLGSMPGVPNLSGLRSFRVLRPLRSVSRLPSLRKIATAFIESIGDLANVMVLLLFILASFTLFGVTFWRGLFHMRCRLTPFPVKMGTCRHATDACWDQFLLDAVTDPDAHRCVPFPNDDMESWTQSTSPWFTSGKQDCVWPIDDTDLRVCSVSPGRGSYHCLRPATFMGLSISRTCGSNYDAFGNPRFIESLRPYGFPRMSDGVFTEAFNWGFTNFDNFVSAFITTFQIVTLEGWSDIMARVIDTWSSSGAVVAFVALIILGGIITLNIVLAVISGSLDKIEHEMDREAETTTPNDTEKSFSEMSAFRRRTTVLVMKYMPKSSKVSKKSRVIADSKVYKNFILAIILINTTILCCDHYGISPQFQIVLDVGNITTTIIFFIDCVLSNIAYGIYTYWSTLATCFDGIIALTSMLEVIIAGLMGSGTGTSVTTIFRSLRLVRLFKMVKQWKSLHSLLNTMARASSDVQSFSILLSLFVFIYSLVGMQFFSNRLHFDPVTGSHIDVSDSKAYASADISRSNFDDIFWSAVTVFQVLSGENWNEVMYDCWKATYVAPLYFMSLVLCGVFCALNLFLAILMLPFDGNNAIASKRIHPEESLSKKQEIAKAQNRIERELLSYVDSCRCCENIRNTARLIRATCDRFVGDKRFDLCVTSVIIMSSIALAVDSPLASPSSVTMLVLNYLFTAVFLVEFLIKVIAYGCKKYIQDRWNCLDLLTVVASILEVANVKGGKTLRVLRAFRVLRPLKMINRFPEVKVVVDALLLSLPSVVDVGAVMLLFFLVFAVFGVTFLKGTFYRCEAELTPEELNLVTYPKLVGEMTSSEYSWLNVGASNCGAGTWGAPKIPSSKELCACLDGEWVETIPQNFNNVLRGFALLFEISTTESWVDVMYAAIDQRGIDMQPVRDNNRLWAVFFVVFLVLGAFFILELFVGVIIENFSRLREIKGIGLMTEAQRQWAATQQFCLRIRPEVLLRCPKRKISALCYHFIMPGSNPWFDRFIVITIIVNSVSIATTSFGDSDEKIRVLSMINLICSSIFVVEAILKVSALGKQYFRSKWNIFDFVVVCGLLLGFIIKASIRDEYLAMSISSLISLIRMGRLIRLIRLVKQLQAPFKTMLSVLPGIANIGALLLLLFFVYAVCGVQLYSTVALQGDLNEQANFRSLGNAMLLLLRFSTGEGWMSVMYALQEDRENCCQDIQYDERSPWCLNEENYPNCTEINGCSAGISAYIYFYSFTIIVSFIILNMIVAIVLEAFEASDEGDILGSDDLDEFVRVWSEFDPNATWFISASDVQRLVSKLEPPLGFDTDGGPVKDECLLSLPVVVSTDKGVVTKKVNIVDVASLLAKRVAKEKQGDEFNELSDGHPVRRELAKKGVAVEGSTITLGDVYLGNAAVILRAVRRFKQRKTNARRRTENGGPPV